MNLIRHKSWPKSFAILVPEPLADHPTATLRRVWLNPWTWLHATATLSTLQWRHPIAETAAGR